MKKKINWPDEFTHWSSSGLSQKAYCELKDISYYSFKNARTKHLKSQSSSKWLPLELSKRDSGSNIYVELPSKAKLYFEQELGIDGLREVLLKLGLL